MADDHADANEADVLDFWQAIKRAEEAAEYSQGQARQPNPLGAVKPHRVPQSVASSSRPLLPSAYTLRQCADDYLEHIRPEAKSAAEIERQIERAVLPHFGPARLVADLTAKEITRWRNKIALSPPTRRGKELDFDPEDSEAVRRRKATANRLLSVLKAMLNHAYRDGLAKEPDRWRPASPFKNVDIPRVRVLAHDECVRLVNAASEEFRPLLRAALLTGCRYGELIALRVEDFEPDSATLVIRQAKSGKPRRVYLTEEGLEFFNELTAGRPGSELILRRANGEPWKRSEQARPMRATSLRAGIDPPISFHMLRHAHAGLLARAGTPLQVISIALGHADSRMSERHYAHLQPDFVADTIRANLPRFSQEKSKVRRVR